MAKLIDNYLAMHEKSKRFPGYSIGAYVAAIAELVAHHSPATLLDFGCGKGFQYLARRYHERWGGLLPYCYDPGVPQLSELPDRQFGGVICSDVMEHIEEPDIAATLDKLILLTDNGGFVFLGISCRPTRKRLDDGRDVHVTIKPPSWWKDQIRASIARVNAPERRVVAHFDVSGHFDEPETPWDSLA